MSNKVWTRNYDNLFSAVFGTVGGKNGSTESAPTYEYPCFRTSDGTYRTIGNPSDNAFSQNNFGALTLPNIGAYLSSDMSSSGYNYAFIQLGSGSGIPSKDDYRLFSAEKSGFKITNTIITSVYDNVEHKYTRCIEIAINYTNSNPIIITEFGIFGCPGYDKTNYGYTTLMYHEVLDTTVTLQQNDTIVIKFYQSIVQPNYTPYPTTV